MAEIIDTYKNVKIMAIGVYVPKGAGGANDGHSQGILGFKDGKEAAVEEMTKLVSEVISQSTLKARPFFVATIPSSTVGRAHPGFTKMMKKLAKQFQILNPDTNLIERTESKQAAHKGGERSQVLAEATTKIPDNTRHTIAGKPVLVLDDVYTTGASMKAGIEHLLKAKAEVVAALVLGQTRR